MYLKRDRRSLFQSRRHEELLPHGRRPARTPPSTFLFLPIHFSNSPETMAVSHSPSAESRRSTNASDNRRMLFHCSSEELQGRAIAPIADGAPNAVYRRCLRTKSTEKNADFHRPQPLARQEVNWSFMVDGRAAANPLRAALRPYSSPVLYAGSRGKESRSGAHRTVFRPVNRIPARH